MSHTDSPSSFTSVGQVLAEARRRRGESLEQASFNTRISAQYLDALERDAALRSFPAPVYARYFLKEYAGYLGLDADSLAATFAGRHGLQEDDLPKVSPGRANGASRSKGWLQELVARIPRGRLASASLPDEEIPPVERSGSGGRDRPAGRRRTGTDGRVSLWAGGPTRDRGQIRDWAKARAEAATGGAITQIQTRGRSRTFSRRRRPAAVVNFRRRRRVAGAIAGTVVLVAGLLIAPRVLPWWSGEADPERDLPRSTAPSRPELPVGGRVIFPEYRVVAFYGAPYDPALGILGIGPNDAAERLVEQADQYTFSERPVLPAFEFIGSIATRDPGMDGLYRTRVSRESVENYLAAARRIEALFVIDVQPGRGDFLAEVQAFEDFLKEPDVGLALDPEWHVGPNQVPGRTLGSVDAKVVNRIIDYLAGIVRRYDLPQKLLVIHQFEEEMIKNKGDVKTVPELAVTFDVDGFGGRPGKRAKYEGFSQPFDQFFHGFKLFYEQDIDLMTPLDVLGLRPSPDFVVYQ